MADSHFYNVGSGLTDIDCTQVTTDYLITDNVNSITGLMDFNNNNLSNVNLINGISLSILNNRTIGTSNVAYLTSNVAYSTSNMAYPLNVAVYDAMAFSNTSLSVTKPTFNASGIVACSNLNVTNTIIRVNGSNLVGTDKKIDYNTWIKGGPVFSNGDNTLAIAALALAGAAAGGVVGAMTLIAGSPARNILDAGGNFANDAVADIGDLLDVDASNLSGQSNKVYVNWKQVTNRCLYNNNGSEKVAFGDDVMISSTKKLLGVNPSSLSSVYDFNGKKIKYIEALPSTYTVFDFNTKELFASQATLCNLTTSNAVITSNVTVPYINTATQVKVGNYYIRSDGIYVGDPILNPFGSQLIIDTSGLYQGTIKKSQITDTEAFNFNALADGQLIWGSFGQTSALNDPFALNSVPLYNV